MADLNITREDAPGGGRYVATLPGVAAEAELTFTRPSPGIVSANHTGVPDEMGGQGVGNALVKALVADAQREGFRIVPRCSFVAALAQRHPDWAGLFVSD